MGGRWEPICIDKEHEKLHRTTIVDVNGFFETTLPERELKQILFFMDIG